MIDLNSKVAELNRVGKSLNSRLKRLGIETVKDLIFYYPFRYDDFSQIVPIKDLKAGQIATVRGRIDLLANRRSPRQRKMLTEGVVTDETDSVKVIWFNQPWIGKSLKAGDEVYLSGKVSGDLFNIFFSSPSYEKVSTANIHTARLVPVYPLTEGVSEKQLRYLIKSVIGSADAAVDFLPAQIIKAEGLAPLGWALKQIHFPQDAKGLARARQRLAFDELFLLQLWSQSIRQELGHHRAAKIKFVREKTKEFINGLEFELTLDQKKAAWEIIRDLENERPMNRLLQGDVGSGKTVVVAIAVYNVALNGYQSAVMAPTEILARQHFETLRRFFFRSGIKIGLLTRSQRFIDDEKINKKEFLSAAARGEIGVIVGTHALIQEEVKFKKLALAVIDEQHRFGVKQREMLKQHDLGNSPRPPLEKRGILPHLLSLTATPIPRSLALTVYGDLDLSLIREMPKNRKKIITRLVPPEKRQLAYNFIGRQIATGRQVFVICPLIDPSDKLGVKSVTQEHEKLDKQIFPHLAVGLLHGRLKSAEKEKVMADFKDNQTKILVATSVVEVGVDVPNATVMMIEGAERFGLAQLHQFRGRVGRSEHQSYCFLFSDNSEVSVVQRLQYLVQCHDGFTLAQKDLEFRGAGRVYGYEQSGFGDFKIADLNDLALIKKAKAAALAFLAQNDLAGHPALQEKLDALGLSKHLE